MREIKQFLQKSCSFKEFLYYLFWIFTIYTEVNFRYLHQNWTKKSKNKEN